MAKKSIIEFPFPLAGLDRGFAFRDQPPFTTTDLQNVRGHEVIKGRARGGQRPGLGKAFHEELGGGRPIRMLAQVTSIGTTDATWEFFWSDDFKRDGSDLGTGYSDADWSALSQPPTKVVLGAPWTEREESIGVRDLLEYNTGFPYTVEMYIIPFNGEHHGTYRIYARMDDDDPDVTDEGVMAVLTLSGAGTYSGNLFTYSGGVMASTSFASGTASGSGWFGLYIDGDSVQCTWQDEALLTQDVREMTGTRVGLGLKTDTTYPDGLALVDVFRVHGSPPGGLGTERRRTYCVASAGGWLYADRTLGIMEEVVGLATDFSHRHLIQAAERTQKLYIADWDRPRVVLTGAVLDATGLIITHADIPDWTDGIGIDPHSDVAVVSDGSTLVTDGTYEVASVGVSGVTLSSAASSGAGTCSLRIERSPKIYDPGANTVSLWTATSGLGSVPTGCHLIALYQDRLVVAAPDYAPHMYYASRAGDPLDWDYVPEDATDPSRPFSGTDADAGKVGDIITALIPFSDDFLVFGCKGSLWVMRGNPAMNGIVDAISYTVGIVGQKAWCQGPQGEFYFLSTDGLYRLPPGAEARPEPLSADRIPDELVRLNSSNNEILLVWNDEQKGVHIFLAPVVRSTDALDTPLLTKALILETLENVSDEIFVDVASDARAAADIQGTNLDPYSDLETAIAAATATRNTIFLAPGTYTLSASAVMPDHDLHIVGLGEVGSIRIEAASGVSPLVDASPGTITETVDYLFKNVCLANVQTDQVAIQVDNSSTTRKMIIDLEDCALEDGGAAIDVDHDGTETVRIYARGGEIEGAINWDVGNPQDRFFAENCEIMGLLTSAGDNVNAHFRYMNCLVKHETCATNGGQTVQRFTSINSTSKTITTDDSSEVYDNLDSADIGSAAKFTETILE